MTKHGKAYADYRQRVPMLMPPTSTMPIELRAAAPALERRRYRRKTGAQRTPEGARAAAVPMGDGYQPSRAAVGQGGRGPRLGR